MTSEIRLDTIKARSGLGTVDVNSSGLNIAGIATASFFYGDGSNLINLSAATSIKNIQVFSTPGTYTYTPTAGTSSFLVIATGGGGGGCSAASPTTGSTGTATTFTPSGTGTTLFSGAGTGAVGRTAPGVGGLTSGGQISIYGGQGSAGYQIVGGGAPSFWGGMDSYGSGGGANNIANNTNAAGGGSGATTIRSYNKTQLGATATINVGSGGAGGGAAGFPGSDGVVVIIEY